MGKFLVILKREYAQVVKKKSFLVITFLMPILMGGMMFLPALLAEKDVADTQTVAVIDRGAAGVGAAFAESLAEYFIDDGEIGAYAVEGLLEVPLGESERFTAVRDSLAEQIKSRQLKYLLVIQPDAHLADSNLLLITNSDDFQTIRRFEYQLTQILAKQRLEASEVNLPVDSLLALTRRVDITTENASGESIPFQIKLLTALVFVMLMYMMIALNGSGLMRSIIEEKTSRIVEVLISSVTPFQLMAGKILGSSAAVLTQVAIWVVTGLVLFLVSGSGGVDMESNMARVVFNPVIVVFFVLFFSAGYVMFATLFALVGSIVNSEKEANNFVFPIVIWMLPSLVAAMSVIRDPYATWAVVMSYFPLSAPTMMMERVAFIAPSVDSYSLFSGIVAEASLSFLSIVASTVVIIWLSGRVFRIGILMYGKRPTLPEIVRWMRYK